MTLVDSYALLVKLQLLQMKSYLVLYVAVMLCEDATDSPRFYRNGPHLPPRDEAAVRQRALCVHCTVNPSLRLSPRGLPSPLS